MTQFATLPNVSAQHPMHKPKPDSDNQSEGSGEFAQVWLADAEINQSRDMPSFLASDVPTDTELADDGEVESTLEGAQLDARATIEIEKQAALSASLTNFDASRSTVNVRATPSIAANMPTIEASHDAQLRNGAVPQSTGELDLATSDTTLPNSDRLLNGKSSDALAAQLAIQSSQNPNIQRQNLESTMVSLERAAAQLQTAAGTERLSNAVQPFPETPQQIASQLSQAAGTLGALAAAPLASNRASSEARFHASANHTSVPEEVRQSAILPTNMTQTSPIVGIAPPSLAAAAQMSSLDLSLGTDKSEPDMHNAALSQSTNSPGMIGSAAQSPAYARHAVQQIAAAIVQITGATTEIALNPEELGRVRISLTTTESGLTVAILAERSETTDLMRRNLEQLARELRDMGYDNPTFTFGDQSDAQDDDANEGSGPPVAEPQITEDLPQKSLRVALSGGLDLKL